MDSKENCCCQKPDQLKEKPHTCSPEQIRKCHGEDPEHPCVSSKNDKT